MDRPRAPLRARGSALLLAAPIAFLACFFAWPVLNIVGEGLRGEQGWDLSGVSEVLGDAGLRQVAWFTLWQALASTALTLLIGLPAAHVLSTYEFHGRRLLQAVLVVPFVLPTVVVGAAFLSLLGRDGLLGVDLRGSALAILMAHAFFNHAVVVRTVGGLWESLDPGTEEAACVLGATRWRAFRHVTWPAIRPAVASAAVIVFLFTFTSFGVVRILGGASRSTIETEIYRQTADLLDLPVASVLALLQLAAVVAMLAVHSWLERRQEHKAVAMGSPARRRVRGRRDQLWVAVNLLLMAGWLGLPIAVLIARSFDVGDRHGLGGWRALSGVTEGSRLFVSPLEAVANSLRFAGLATLLAVVLGGLAAAALARSPGRAARSLDTVLLLPLGISAVTVGFGFLLALDEPVDLRASPWLIPIAQAVVAIPFVVRTMTPVLRSIDPQLREAAAVLGASPRRSWLAVDLPLVWRAVLVAAGFAFAISLGEFGATVVIARADAPTIPITIARLLGRPGAINVAQGFALSVVLMILTTTAVLVVDRWRPRTDGGRRLVVTPRIEAAGVRVEFGSTLALDDVDVSVEAGEVVAVLGPSGSGKSTLLRTFAGLHRPDAGTIAIDGVEVTATPPHERGVGMMFQHHTLFPHLDVGANVGFGLRMQGQRGPAAVARVQELLGLVGLDGMAHRDVASLSGGEQQRVALARALAPAPRVLLLDEPLGSLDRPRRERLVVELQAVFARLGLTVVAVTHDHAEAFALADRLVLIDRGQILQAGAPSEVWRAPASSRVAELLGFTNLIDVIVRDGRASSAWGDLGAAEPGVRRAVIRPEAVRLDGDGALHGVVVAGTFAGSRGRVRLEVDGAPPLDADVPAADLPPIGGRVGIAFDPAGIDLLPS